MDFFATTDHTMMIGPQSWPATRAAADAATTTSFVGIASYELGWYYDHVNVFDVDTIIPKTETSQANHTPAIDFVDVLLPNPTAIGQFNDPMWHEADFDGTSAGHPTVRRRGRLLENYYWGDDVGDGAWETWSLGSYVRCLDAGWHVMPTAVSDAHYVGLGHHDGALRLPHRAAVSQADSRRSVRGRYAPGAAPRGRTRTCASSSRPAARVMGPVVTPATRYAMSVAVIDPDTLVAADRIDQARIVSDGGVVVASTNVTGQASPGRRRSSSSTARYCWLRVTTVEA